MTLLLLPLLLHGTSGIPENQTFLTHMTMRGSSGILDEDRFKRSGIGRYIRICQTNISAHALKAIGDMQGV